MKIVKYYTLTIFFAFKRTIALLLLHNLLSQNQNENKVRPNSCACFFV
jgi:hypothetical protein